MRSQITTPHALQRMSVRGGVTKGMLLAQHAVPLFFFFFFFTFLCGVCGVYSVEWRPTERAHKTHVTSQGYALARAYTWHSSQTTSGMQVQNGGQAGLHGEEKKVAARSRKAVQASTSTAFSTMVFRLFLFLFSLFRAPTNHRAGRERDNPLRAHPDSNTGEVKLLVKQNKRHITFFLVHALFFFFFLTDVTARMQVGV